MLVYAIGIDGEGEPTIAPRAVRPPPPHPDAGPVPVPRPPRRPRPMAAAAAARRLGRRLRRAGGDDRVNVAALRDMTDDSGGRTEIIRDPRDLESGDRRHRRRVEQAVLPRLPVAREEGRPLALDPRRGAGTARTACARGTRLRRELNRVECRVPLLATALGLSLLGSCGGLLVASLAAALHRRASATRLVPWLVSYAVGALLGVALLALLPEALETLSPPAVFGTLLAGILAFFILEKLVLLRHCHTDECQVHGATAPLVLIGDAFHNFIDGAIICAAVLTSVPLGVNTAIAVAAHEIPQEVGDVAILLAAGYSRGGALLLNVVSGASGIARRAASRYGAVGVVPGIRPFVLAFSSASLLYIAMSDLIPDLHRGQIDANAVAPGAAHRRRHRHGRRLRTAASDDMAIDKVNLATVEKMWRREVEAAHTYRHARRARARPEAPRHPAAPRRAGRQARGALVRAHRRRHRARARSAARSSAACRGSSASPIRTSSCTASSRRRTRPKPSTTS